MEDEETLETSARFSQLPDPVKNQVNDLLANGVVSPGVVVGGVLLASDQLNKNMKIIYVSYFINQTCSGWNKARYVPSLTSSMTVGSRSTNTALGTCLPEPVSEKKVLKLSSPPPAVLSLGMVPSG